MTSSSLQVSGTAWQELQVAQHITAHGRDSFLYSDKRAKSDSKMVDVEVGSALRLWLRLRLLRGASSLVLHGWRSTLLVRVPGSAKSDSMMVGEKLAPP